MQGETEMTVCPFISVVIFETNILKRKAFLIWAGKGQV
jgi:hypothetical protein